MPVMGIGQRREHRVQTLATGFVARGQCLLATGEGGQARRAGDRIGGVPGLLPIQHAGQRAAMHARFLTYIQARQMEAEGAHPPQQATHREAAGMVALVLVQAAQDQFDVVGQFLRRRIGAFRILHRRLHARAHAVVEQAVRHVGMTRARGDLGQQDLVMLHACLQFIADRHPFGGLAEQAGQLQQVFLVAAEHGLALRIQGVADGAGIHVRIAVHVAAYPGTEAQQARQRQFLAIGIQQCLLQRFVQHWNHPVQHLHQIEADMLALVFHGRAHGRGIGGLPRGGQGHAEPRGIGGRFTRGALAVEVVDQAGHHQLLFFQQRAAHRFGRVRSEHRLDVDPRQPLGKLVQGDALRFEIDQCVLQAIGLRRGGTGTLVVAAAANAVHALGDVHHLEIGTERTHHRFGARRRQAGQRIVEIGQGSVAFAAGDGARTHLFHIIEKLRGDLLGEQVADQCAESAYIVTQGNIGSGKNDAASVLVHLRRTGLGNGIRSSLPHIGVIAASRK